MVRVVCVSLLTKATLCAGTVVTRGTLGQEPIFESTNFFTGPATGETC